MRIQTAFFTAAVVIFLLAVAVVERRSLGLRAALVIANGPEPESLDPAKATSQPDGRIVSSLFEGLTRYRAQDAAPEPGLAQDWTISPDGRVYTFTLREGARWSDGSAITAQDVVFSWRRVVDPKTGAGYASLLEPVAHASAIMGGAAPRERLGVEALDAHRVRVELERPTPYFLALCAHWTLAIVPEAHVRRNGSRWSLVEPMPSSGAYQLERWRVNDRVRIRRNPHYWDAEHVRLDTVDWLPVTAPNVALNLFESGAVDVIWDKGLLPVELLDRLIERPDFHSFRYLGTYFIRFNTTRSPFDRPEVRRAFSLAIDRDALLRRVVPIGETVASGLTPPGIPGYEPVDAVAFDPEAARVALAQAGYPNGEGFPQVSYFFNASAAGSGALHQQIAVELQAMWADVLGVETGMRRAESKAFIAAQRALDYDFSRSSWIGDYNDPYTFLEVFAGESRNNRTGWRDTQYDAFLQQSNGAVDSAQRERILRDAERRLVDQEAVIAPLFHYAGLHAFDPEVWEGIHPNVLDQHPIRAVARRREEAFAQ